MLKDTPFDMPKFIAVSSNRTNDVANKAIHEGNNRVTGAVRVRRKGDLHLQEIANCQPERTTQASTRNTLCGFKEFSGTQNIRQLLARRRSGSWSDNGDRMVCDAPLQGAVHNTCAQPPRDHGEKDIPLPESKQTWIPAMRHSIGQEFFTDWRFEKQVTSPDQPHALKTRATPFQMRRRNLHPQTQFAEVGQPRGWCRGGRSGKLSLLHVALVGS